MVLVLPDAKFLLIDTAKPQMAHFEATIAGLLLSQKARV